VGLEQVRGGAAGSGVEAKEGLLVKGGGAVGRAGVDGERTGGGGLIGGQAVGGLRGARYLPSCAGATRVAASARSPLEVGRPAATCGVCVISPAVPIRGGWRRARGPRPWTAVRRRGA